MTRPAARLLISHALAATAMSMPWPALLAQVWTETRSDSWLGATGAARMLPYVVLSAAAGLLADRVRRTSAVRWSTAIRAGLLLGCAGALAADLLWPAVAFAVLTVAVGTPAYPAAVAAMPGLAGPRHSARLTDLLVTAEVTAFVVGPAVGGLLIGVGADLGSVVVAAGIALVAWPLLAGLDSGRAAAQPLDRGRGRVRTVFASPGVPLAIAVVAGINFVEAAASVGLLGLSERGWAEGERSFGIATAALGFGSLAAPLLGLVVRLRPSLWLSGGGVAAAGLAPGVAVAVGPLAVLGAAGTVVECASTDTLQRSVPDHVRSFSLGLADMIMVLAAMIGALVAPQLVSAVGPVALFVGLGVGFAVGFGIAASWRTGGRRAAGSAEDAGELLDRERVAAGAGPDHDDLGHGRDERVVPEVLTLVHVGEVDLDHRQRDGGQRVAEGDRGVGEGATVDDDADAVLASGVDGVEQHPLVVALHRSEIEAEVGGAGPGELLEVSQGLGAVDLRLTCPQQVEVGPVDQQQTLALGGFAHPRTVAPAPGP